MARNLSHLAKRMRDLSDRIETLGSEIAVEAATAGLEELVGVTPVDTSQALSNWQVGIGGPVNRTIGPYKPGKFGSTRGVSSREALDVGIEALRAKKPGQPIYLSNLLEYIKGLDEGSSRQFPGGFSNRAVYAVRIALANRRRRKL